MDLYLHSYVTFGTDKHFQMVGIEQEGSVEGKARGKEDVSSPPHP